MAVVITVVHTHALVCTLRELIGLNDVGEKSFGFTVLMDQGLFVLGTTLDYTIQDKTGGLAVHNPTVESLTVQDHQAGSMASLHERSGTDVEERCSGFMPRTRELVRPLMLTMMSCSIMWEMDNGFH